ncbi:hypothetical protein INS49_009984 [Diaporthe citri]|uniref:uncharacterized protein n=1 Tax=Diaporthe citri TaxID=83186 RepID=UPI001C813ADC|nr:uncharacterized protein INS49_009984 [Diaporthe citri]KAG6361756.1 hypothetical protein INS49_009984 [Diaporthe citri]
MATSAKLINREEWSTFAPSFLQLAAQGPGVAPAHTMVEHINKLLPFSTATLVVDMGCGPGQVTDAILREHSTEIPTAASVIGADNNPQMLAVYTARKTNELKEGKEYWVRAGTATTDIHDCDAFSDDSVTHMLAGFVVFLVPEPARAVEAMRRKLAPGGALAFSSWASSDWQDLMYYPKKVRPDLVMPTPPTDWTQPDGVRTQLQQIGAFTDYDEVCRFIITKMPLAARVISQMSDEEVLQTHALMVSDLKAKYPTVPAEMVGTATVAYCLK